MFFFYLFSSIDNLHHQFSGKRFHIYRIFLYYFEYKEIFDLLFNSWSSIFCIILYIFCICSWVLGWIIYNFCNKKIESCFSFVIFFFELNLYQAKRLLCWIRYLHSNQSLSNLRLNRHPISNRIRNFRQLRSFWLLWIESLRFLYKIDGTFPLSTNIFRIFPQFWVHSKI